MLLSSFTGIPYTYRHIGTPLKSYSAHMMVHVTSHWTPHSRDWHHSKAAMLNPMVTSITWYSPWQQSTYRLTLGVHQLVKVRHDNCCHDILVDFAWSLAAVSNEFLKKQIKIDMQKCPTLVVCMAEKGSEREREREREREKEREREREGERERDRQAYREKEKENESCNWERKERVKETVARIKGYKNVM